MTFVCPKHGYYTPVSGTTVALCPACQAEPPALRPGTHEAIAAALDGYHAANLLEALKLAPDTGDWHGSLRFACQMALDREGDRAPKPNQSAEQMAERALTLAHQTKGNL
jgi:hypothetical protein